MKKLVLLIAALSLFAVACKSNTTIETGTDGGDVAQATAAPESGSQDNASTEPEADPGSGDDAEEDERGSGVQATDPTPAPAPTEASGESGGDASPTEVPVEEPTSAAVGPAPGAAEAIQAVVDANDWCEAALAVENGFEAFDTLNFTDPVALEQGVNQSLAVVAASRRLAPNAIAGDVDQTIAGFTAFAGALEEANWSFIDLDLSVIEDLDDPMTIASYNIELYNYIECGIGSDPGAPPVVLGDGTIEDGDDDDDGTPPEFDGTIRDQAVQGLVEAGFTVDEANCILEDLDFSDPAALTDPAAMLTVFTDCGISLDRLAQLGG